MSKIDDAMTAMCVAVGREARRAALLAMIEACWAEVEAIPPGYPPGRPRLRNKGESLQAYRVAMGWDKWATVPRAPFPRPSSYDFGPDFEVSRPGVLSGVVGDVSEAAYAAKCAGVPVQP